MHAIGTARISMGKTYFADATIGKMESIHVYEARKRVSLSNF